MILTNLFKLVVTNFFEEFWQLEVEALVTSAWKTEEAVLQPPGVATVIGRRQEKAV